MTDHRDGYVPKDVGLHLTMTAYTGTANHLVEQHGVKEDDIDRDDPHGLGHDHAVLHGADVTPKGNLRVVT